MPRPPLKLYRLFRFPFFLVLALLLCSCGTFSSRVISDPLPASNRLQNGGSLQAEVDRLVEPLIQSREIDSAAVGVVTSDGRRHTFGYGSAGGKENSVPVAPDGIFQIGSVSKVFIASVLAVLVDEGILRYDDTVRALMPLEVEMSESVGALTVYDLVTHTSGLPREGAGGAPLYHFARYLFTGKNIYGYFDQDYLYRFLRKARIRSKEKGRYQYSNVGAALLAHLMELKTGKPFPELAREKLFAPLGMRDTGFVLNEEQTRRRVTGHSGQQPFFMRRHRPIDPWDMGAPMHYAGGAYSTVNDLLTFAAAHLRQGGGALAPVLEATHAVQVRTPVEDVAYGWVVNYFDDGKTTLFYKHGMVSGYSAYIGFNPDKDVAVVVLCGTFNWEDKIGHNLLLTLSGSAAKKG